MGIKNSDKKQEASNRLLQLKQSLHISQRILKGFDNGKLFYSYIPLVGNAKIAVLDKKRLEIVENFQKRYNSLVYHAIESYGMFALLYVSDDEESWEYERLEDNYISAYVYNINHPECSEFGDIILTGNNGALVRTDVLM